MRERHGSGRSGWLRAAVLGANDGIISTSSLLIGVAAAGSSQAAIFTAGLAGLVAGAMSMATGEYVSVSSQADTERADLARERAELEEDPDAEHRSPALLSLVDPIGGVEPGGTGGTDVTGMEPGRGAPGDDDPPLVGQAHHLVAGFAPDDVDATGLADRAPAGG